MTIDYSISLGNICTVVTLIGFLIINTITVTNRIAKFITVTDMKFQAGEKKFVEHDLNLKKLEDDIKELEEKRELMRNEQIRLRAELPLELRYIKTELQTVKDGVLQILAMKIKENKEFGGG